VAEQVAEEVDIRRSAPKGAFNFESFSGSLKRYSDTKLTRKLKFFRTL
jgi:hypothetical protein